ncbi:hypothetical protein EB796_013718 [Bugula neritina]|uniref:Uncharacterized protein n=1 Tax=Bugula neritina TaxID=10212 RepID=A0A7J7JB57_BUGNE|nr:hypothetical protein EB796_018202 [Bugula neritina]KAF6027967.1 hypothetical protein EB796_013718 [Bugula neritina]
MEEYDIMQRANIFLNNIKPDKELCLAPGESRPEELLACSMSYLDAPIYEYQNDGAYTLQHHANPQPVYVIDERSYVVFKENKNRIVLPLG